MKRSYQELLSRGLAKPALDPLRTCLCVWGGLRRERGRPSRYSGHAMVVSQNIPFLGNRPRKDLPVGQVKRGLTDNVCHPGDRKAVVSFS